MTWKHSTAATPEALAIYWHSEAYSRNGLTCGVHKNGQRFVYLLDKACTGFWWQELDPVPDDVQTSAQKPDEWEGLGK